MNKNDFFYNTIFKSKLLECYGDMFQQYFYSIMQFKDSSFRKIEPQGSYGDRKCDGYIFNEGIFFQVYGPKDNTSSNKEVQKRAINKIAEDFQGLQEQINKGYWEPIKEFYFVFNSERGIFPDLDEKIRELTTKHTDVKFGIYDRNDILKLFWQLDEYEKSNICNCIAPDIEASQINFSIVSEIIEFMVKTHNSQPPSSNIGSVPDFIEKIEFNKLNKYYESHLILGSYRIYDLNNFLSSYNTDIEQHLYKIYTNLYDKAKNKYPNDSNMQCQYLVDNSYNKNNTDSNSISNYVSNIYVILAKYFETCDIFEEPQKK